MNRDDSFITDAPVSDDAIIGEADYEDIPGESIVDDVQIPSVSIAEAKEMAAGLFYFIAYNSDKFAAADIPAISRIPKGGVGGGVY